MNFSVIEHSARFSRDQKLGTKLLLGLVGWTMPSVGWACSMCADAAARVTMPGVLDAAWCLAGFVVLSVALIVFGRVTRDPWRLNSVLHWLSIPAGVAGGVAAGGAGLTLAAGTVLIVASLIRVFRLSKLSDPSRRERMSAVLGVFFVLGVPLVVLVGNQQTQNPDYLLYRIGSWHYITSELAFEKLNEMEDAGDLACAHLEALEDDNSPDDAISPMGWFGLMQLSAEHCPDRAQAVQERCAFPADAEMTRDLVCGEVPD